MSKPAREDQRVDPRLEVNSRASIPVMTLSLVEEYPQDDRHAESHEYIPLYLSPNCVQEHRRLRDVKLRRFLKQSVNIANTLAGDQPVGMITPSVGVVWGHDALLNVDRFRANASEHAPFDSYGEAGVSPAPVDLVDALESALRNDCLGTELHDDHLLVNVKTSAGMLAAALGNVRARVKLAEKLGHQVDASKWPPTGHPIASYMHTLAAYFSDVYAICTADERNPDTMERLFCNGGLPERFRDSVRSVRADMATGTEDEINETRLYDLMTKSSDTVNDSPIRLRSRMELVTMGLRVEERIVHGTPRFLRTKATHVHGRKLRIEHDKLPAGALKPMSAEELRKLELVPCSITVRYLGAIRALAREVINTHNARKRELDAARRHSLQNRSGRSRSRQNAKDRKKNDRDGDKKEETPKLSPEMVDLCMLHAMARTIEGFLSQDTIKAIAPAIERRLQEKSVPVDATVYDQPSLVRDGMSWLTQIAFRSQGHRTTYGEGPLSSWVSLPLSRIDPGADESNREGARIRVDIVPSDMMGNAREADEPPVADAPPPVSHWHTAYSCAGTDLYAAFRVDAEDYDKHKDMFHLILEDDDTSCIVMDKAALELVDEIELQMWSRELHVSLAFNFGDWTANKLVPYWCSFDEISSYLQFRQLLSVAGDIQFVIAKTFEAWVAVGWRPIIVPTKLSPQEQPFKHGRLRSIVGVQPAQAAGNHGRDRHSVEPALKDRTAPSVDRMKQMIEAIQRGQVDLLGMPKRCWPRGLLKLPNHNTFSLPHSARFTEERRQAPFSAGDPQTEEGIATWEGGPASNGTPETNDGIEAPDARTADRADDQSLLTLEECTSARSAVRRRMTAIETHVRNGTWSLAFARRATEQIQNRLAVITQAEDRIRESSSRGPATPPEPEIVAPPGLLPAYRPFDGESSSRPEQTPLEVNIASSLGQTSQADTSSWFHAENSSRGTDGIQRIGDPPRCRDPSTRESQPTPTEDSGRLYDESWNLHPFEWFPDFEGLEDWTPEAMADLVARRNATRNNASDRSATEITEEMNLISGMSPEDARAVAEAVESILSSRLPVDPTHPARGDDGMLTEMSVRSLDRAIARATGRIPDTESTRRSSQDRATDRTPGVGGTNSEQMRSQARTQATERGSRGDTRTESTSDRQSSGTTPTSGGGATAQEAAGRSVRQTTLGDVREGDVEPDAESEPSESVAGMLVSRNQPPRKKDAVIMMVMGDKGGVFGRGISQSNSMLKYAILCEVGQEARFPGMNALNHATSTEFFIDLVKKRAHGDSTDSTLDGTLFEMLRKFCGEYRVPCDVSLERAAKLIVKKSDPWKMYNSKSRITWHYFAVDIGALCGRYNTSRTARRALTIDMEHQCTARSCGTIDAFCQKIRFLGDSCGVAGFLMSDTLERIIKGGWRAQRERVWKAIDTLRIVEVALESLDAVEEEPAVADAESFVSVRSIEARPATARGWGGDSYAEAGDRPSFGPIIPPVITPSGDRRPPSQVDTAWIITRQSTRNERRHDNWQPWEPRRQEWRDPPESVVEDTLADLTEAEVQRHLTAPVPEADAEVLQNMGRQTFDGAEIRDADERQSGAVAAARARQTAQASGNVPVRRALDLARPQLPVQCTNLRPNGQACGTVTLMENDPNALAACPTCSGLLTHPGNPKPLEVRQAYQCTPLNEGVGLVSVRLHCQQVTTLHQGADQTHMWRPHMLNLPMDTKYFTCLCSKGVPQTLEQIRESHQGEYLRTVRAGAPRMTACGGALVVFDKALDTTVEPEFVRQGNEFGIYSPHLDGEERQESLYYLLEQPYKQGYHLFVNDAAANLHCTVDGVSDRQPDHRGVQTIMQSVQGTPGLDLESPARIEDSVEALVVRAMSIDTVMDGVEKTQLVHERAVALAANLRVGDRSGYYPMIGLDHRRVVLFHAALREVADLIKGQPSPFSVWQRFLHDVDLKDPHAVFSLDASSALRYELFAPLLDKAVIEAYPAVRAYEAEKQAELHLIRTGEERGAVCPDDHANSRFRGAWMYGRDRHTMVRHMVEEYAPQRAATVLRAMPEDRQIATGIKKMRDCKKSWDWIGETIGWLRPDPRAIGVMLAPIRKLHKSYFTHGAIPSKRIVHALFVIFRAVRKQRLQLWELALMVDGRCHEPGHLIGILQNCPNIGAVYAKIKKLPYQFLRSMATPPPVWEINTYTYPMSTWVLDPALSDFAPELVPMDYAAGAVWLKSLSRQEASGETLGDDPNQTSTTVSAACAYVLVARPIVRAHHEYYLMEKPTASDYPQSQYTVMCSVDPEFTDEVPLYGLLRPPETMPAEWLESVQEAHLDREHAVAAAISRSQNTRGVQSLQKVWTDLEEPPVVPAQQSDRGAEDRTDAATLGASVVGQVPYIGAAARAAQATMLITAALMYERGQIMDFSTIRKIEKWIRDGVYVAVSRFVRRQGPRAGPVGPVSFDNLSEEWLIHRLPLSTTMLRNQFNLNGQRRIIVDDLSMLPLVGDPKADAFIECCRVREIPGLCTLQDLDRGLTDDVEVKQKLVVLAGMLSKAVAAFDRARFRDSPIWQSAGGYNVSGPEALYTELRVQPRGVLEPYLLPNRGDWRHNNRPISQYPSHGPEVAKNGRRLTDMLDHLRPGQALEPTSGLSFIMPTHPNHEPVSSVTSDFDCPLSDKFGRIRYGFPTAVPLTREQIKRKLQSLHVEPGSGVVVDHGYAKKCWAESGSFDAHRRIHCAWQEHIREFPQSFARTCRSERPGTLGFVTELVEPRESDREAPDEEPSFRDREFICAVTQGRVRPLQTHELRSRGCQRVDKGFETYPGCALPIVLMCRCCPKKRAQKMPQTVAYTGSVILGNVVDIEGECLTRMDQPDRARGHVLTTPHVVNSACRIFAGEHVVTNGGARRQERNTAERRMGGSGFIAYCKGLLDELSRYPVVTHGSTSESCHDVTTYRVNLRALSDTGPRGAIGALSWNLLGTRFVWTTAMAKCVHILIHNDDPIQVWLDTMEGTPWMEDYETVLWMNVSVILNALVRPEAIGPVAMSMLENHQNRRLIFENWFPEFRSRRNIDVGDAIASCVGSNYPKHAVCVDCTSARGGLARSFWTVEGTKVMRCLPCAASGSQWSGTREITQADLRDLVAWSKSVHTFVRRLEYLITEDLGMVMLDEMSPDEKAGYATRQTATGALTWNYPGIDQTPNKVAAQIAEKARITRARRLKHVLLDSILLDSSGRNPSLVSDTRMADFIVRGLTQGGDPNNPQHGRLRQKIISLEQRV